VRWDKTGKWFWAKCIGFDQENVEHTIKYDDGSTEHLVLVDVTWKKTEDQVMEEMVVEEVEVEEVEVALELEEQVMEDDNGNEADDDEQEQEQDQERVEGVSTGRWDSVVATIADRVVQYRPWGT
jgi:hypothetical protein